MTQRTGNINGGNNQSNGTSTSSSDSSSDSISAPSRDEQVIDFKKVREKKLAEKRRSTERIFLKDLLGVYSIIENNKMFPIDLVEVSEEGCSFQLPHNPDNPWPKDGRDMPLRLYFSNEMYLEIYVQIKHSRPCIEKKQRYVRYGCSVDQTTQSFSAYQQFVRFLKLYSEQAHQDKGDVTVFYL